MSIHSRPAIRWIMLWSFLLCLPDPGDSAEINDAWKAVNEAIEQGLPKTAIQRLTPIITDAKKRQSYAEAVKAVSQQILLQDQIQGNLPEEKIDRMQAELADAPPEMVPVMRSLLAHWMWQYFQENRWRFLQRTSTGAPPGDNLRNWDLTQILAEIDNQFTMALSARQPLAAIPTGHYEPVLVQGTAPVNYRPTLFDILAHDAIDFYASGEHAGNRAQDAFELLVDSPIFADQETFLKWKPNSTDPSSRLVKALQIFQDLLRMHQNDQDLSALADVDLHRLRLGFNHAVGEGKINRYTSALERFTEQWPKHEITARAIHHWAAAINQTGDHLTAAGLCRQAIHQFPESAGAKMCQNLVQQIEAKHSHISTERVWNSPWPTLHIDYRNLTTVFFRIVKAPWEQLIQKRLHAPENLDDAQRRQALSWQPVFKWTAQLPATEDYRIRRETLKTPTTLKPGFYYLIASHNRSFSKHDNQISFASFWVSNLAIVMRPEGGSGTLEGFVLNAKTGGPIEGALVNGWHYGRDRHRQKTPIVKTDSDGLFHLDHQGDSQLRIFARHNDDTLATAHDYHIRQREFSARTFERTMLFTDRSLYRPGQIVQYKGLCIDVDQQHDNYQVIGNRIITIAFFDTNGQEIKTHQHRTNDYGSFSGSFSAPQDRLGGRMSIRLTDGPQGSTPVHVEQYKRPKFQVTLDSPERAPRLNDVVHLNGKGIAYTGAPVSGAQVRYRVVRELHWPAWPGMFRWPPLPSGPEQEIAHGQSTTDTDGTFAIAFPARPDLAVSQQHAPTFRFTIHVDVTDISGETRSARHTINVGYTALQTHLSAPAWITAHQAFDLSLHTTSLDGVGQKAEGILTVYRLQPPDHVHRAPLNGQGEHHPWRFHDQGQTPPKLVPPADLSRAGSWPLGDITEQHGFTTNEQGMMKRPLSLPPGAYRVVVKTEDRFGNPVTGQYPLEVLDPAAARLNIPIPHLFKIRQRSLEPGAELQAIWGTGYEQGRAYIELEHRGRRIHSDWTEPGKTQLLLNWPIDESMRGGFTLRVTMVRENRAYLENHKIDVPWTNQQLDIRWEHFVSKLEPAKHETWTAIVRGPHAQTAVAEMVATLYDESLDAYVPHHWSKPLHIFRQDYSRLRSHFENSVLHFHHLAGRWLSKPNNVSWSYTRLDPKLVGHHHRFQAANMKRAMDNMALEADVAASADAPGEERARPVAREPSSPDLSQASPDLSQVSPRQNLNETAFFFPHLISSKEGQVKLVFTMPEALTRWKFMGLAHDRQLRFGKIEGSVETAKELMVEPNPPRFLREGDILDFTVKVTNQSDQPQQGTVRLTFNDARTGEAVDEQIGNSQLDVPFVLPAHESRNYSWKLNIPLGAGVLIYKAVGSTGQLSDGEQGYLPVLSRRIRVTTSLPLPVRGKGSKTFDFSALRRSHESETLQHQRLSVQMVSHPSWYAVLALPYLMEYPHQCTEQTFNRLYANLLAQHIANSDPKIRRIFELWKGTAALDSPLEKNQTLKSLLLAETPWLIEAADESASRRNVGVLFDRNRLDHETSRLMRRLTDLQQPNGAWPWFPGGPTNDFMTLYITSGFGRLRHLGIPLDIQTAIRAIAYLDNYLDRIYRDILRHGDLDKNHLSATIAFYLYGRSFFLEDEPIPAKSKTAVTFFLQQASRYWLRLGNRQSQAHLALALHRFGDAATAQSIMNSLQERSVHDDELGMFWRDQERSWWWYRAPIETQAMMIEAFDEVRSDAESVEACKVWLLKQKETQNWKTTKATADAVYAMLLRGTNWLVSDQPVTITMGGQSIDHHDAEAGSGYYESHFLSKDIRPDLAEIVVTKSEEGISWGSVHWQFLEDIEKIKAHRETPLQLNKQLFLRQLTKQGPQLTHIDGSIRVGDELIVRIELQTDRDMEYVHLQDHRASGTEPVNVLSRYKYQDGLAYYETTHDTASHFFIDYLPKGSYVFEYPVRVVHRGRYPTGVARIQCLYAPQYNSHSENINLLVEN